MKHIIFILSWFFAIALTGCSESAPKPEPEPCQRTVLVYMIATNNLSPYASLDLDEMIEGMQSAEVSQHCRWLVYMRNYGKAPELVELKRDSHSGKVNLLTLKTYPTIPLSTAPERLTNVIEDMKRLAPAAEYGLILWSHALNWESSRYWFGTDRGEQSEISSPGHMDIPVLAKALAGNTFSFIWADCCYLGSIEVAWELKDLCKYYISYATETMGYGAPYQLLLPRMMRAGEPDIVGAARDYFSYYDSMQGSYRSATISVVHTEKLETLANMVRNVIASPRTNPDFSNVINFARDGSGPTQPYYDMGEYLNALSTDTEGLDNTNVFLPSIFAYKAATPSFLNSITIGADRFSGLSISHFTDSGSQSDEFYKTLSWYNAIYK